MSDDLHAGAVIAGKYRLEHPLGEGGFGAVWEARQLSLERRVAIKFLKALMSENARIRFEREARALGRLSDPHCVALYDFGYTTSGQAYLATEYVDGETLRDWLARPHGVDEIVGIARQIALALAAAHHQKVVHRDLKPANILVAADFDGRPFVKVLDFGLAKMTGETGGDITKTGEVFGTPGYMSPEQLRGQRSIGPPTDLYCLGIVLFEMLEQRPPFAGATGLEVCMKHLMEDAPAVQREVSPRLAQLVGRLMSKIPEDRPSAAEVVRELQPARRAPRAPVAARPAPRGTPTRWRAPVVVAAAVVGALAIVIIFATRERTQAPAKPPPPVHIPLPAKSSAPHRLVTTVDNTPPPRGSRGCGNPMHSGRQVLRHMVGLTESTVLAYVPQPYDPNRAYPIVMLLHENGQRPKEFMDEVGVLEPIADREGFVMVAPGAASAGLELMLGEELWNVGDRTHAWDTLKVARAELCIEPDRVFIVGHASGGHAAEKMACEFDGVTGIALSSHRLAGNERPCVPLHPVPVLFLAPVKDIFDPVEGRTGESARWPLARHEHHWMSQNGCSEDPTVTRYGKSECSSYDCKVPFVSCHIDGTRHWRAVPSSPNEATADFPYGEVIWKFFASIPPAAKEDD